MRAPGTTKEDRGSAAGDLPVAFGGEAVLFDCLGTLVHLLSPAPRLRAELRRRADVEVSERAASAAFTAEIGYYLEHHLAGHDARSLAELRDRCAAVVAVSLGLRDLPLATVREAMLGAIEFAAYADAAPALRELRAAGVRLVAASNWDCSLPSVLGRVGLAPLLDGVVSSAVAGAAKPDERLFRAALEAAGVEPARAVFVGDSLERDVAGAQAAGMRALLLDRGAGSAGECRGDGDGEPVARSHTAAAVRPEALGGRAIDGDVRVIWTLAQLRSLT